MYESRELPPHLPVWCIESDILSRQITWKYYSGKKFPWGFSRKIRKKNEV